MKIASVPEIRKKSVAALGLDPSKHELDSTEALAAALRRASGFFSPCPRRQLIDSVTTPLTGLIEDQDQIAKRVEEVLESLVVYGDLEEEQQQDPEDPTNNPSLMYWGYPKFVRRKDGTILIFGSNPDKQSPVPDHLSDRVEYSQYTRLIHPNEDENLAQYLIEYGFTELSEESWIKTPAKETAINHINLLNNRLDARPDTDLEGWEIIDPNTPVRYWHDRWTQPQAENGRFVGKRPGPYYGGDIWCYSELQDGKVKKYLDLPLAGSRYSGFDEGCRLQMAIDSETGNPQQYEHNVSLDGTVRLHFSLPVPRWARRRWAYWGSEINPYTRNVLFGYEFPETMGAGQADFARDYLWMVERPEKGR